MSAPEPLLSFDYPAWVIFREDTLRTTGIPGGVVLGYTGVNKVGGTCLVFTTREKAEAAARGIGIPGAIPVPIGTRAVLAAILDYVEARGVKLVGLDYSPDPRDTWIGKPLAKFKRLLPPDPVQAPAPTETHPG